MTQVWCVALICFLVSVPVRGQESQTCIGEFETLPDHGLEQTFFDNAVGPLPNVSDVKACLAACCAKEDCQLALVGTPQDGLAQCFLVSCMEDGKDVCSLRPLQGFTVYRRSQISQRADIPSLGSTERCRAPMLVGPCRAAFPRFYYDATNQTCNPFIFGGCGSNGNIFTTEEECKSTCDGVTAAVTPTAASSGPVARRVALAYGKHPQSMANLYTVEIRAKLGCGIMDDPVFSPSQAPISLFSLGAHVVKVSVFGDTVPCFIIAYTNVFPASPSEGPLPTMTEDDFAAQCQAEPVSGPCRAYMPRFFYNSTTRTCQSFIYGGCRGNKNSYASANECHATCTVTVIPNAKKASAQKPTDDQEACTAAYKSGPCRAHFRMFYFDPATQTCKQFTYGGCQGNANRYGTEEECMAKCSGAGKVEEHGHHHMSRWTPAFFLVATLAIMSILLLVGLLLVSVRKVRSHRRHRRDDKEELLPEDQLASEVHA
ncbi:kunitz-type protease inhibitor 2 [Megalops cyprinoides]|uniref:kunitz-type protease inhibitor 2 n=1 Tax=Megalops cyprinoides TaxID=118141 RepID=UPI001864CCC2|nr:kunitz-type protease inhibitor 2 [Megalops cyprinoides]